MTNSNDDYEVIFVASYLDKRTGKRVYASTFGKKAFPIRIRKKK